MFAVYEQAPGASAARLVGAHPDRAAAEYEALELVASHARADWRIVEFVHDGRRQRWVLRRATAWASVEVREEAAAAPAE